MTRMFRETLPDLLGDGFEVDDVTVELVQYRRAHRCVLRYELSGTQGGHAEHRTVYGKVADSGGALVGPVVNTLRDRLVDKSGVPFLLPRSLGFTPDLQLALLEAIPGEPRVTPLLKARVAGVTDGAAGGLTLEDAIDACAAAASALHTSGIDLGSRRALDADLHEVRKGIADIQPISPDLAVELDRWLQYLEAYAEQSDPLPFTLGHGDFTHTQLIFDGMQAGLVDFDTICQAEPALDLGQFLAYLRFAAYKAAKGAAAPDTLGDELSDRFLETYLAAAGFQPDHEALLRQRVPVYEVTSLMRMAVHSWRNLKGAKLENVLHVLGRQLGTLR